MKADGVYSFWKLLALSLVFLTVGSAVAIGIEKVASSTLGNSPKMFIVSDRTTYHIGENLVIFIANLQDEEIRFETQPYGLHFEKLLDGKWEAASANFDYSCHPSLGNVLSGESAEFCKVHVTIPIGESFTLGTYRVTSSGKIGEIGVEASSEFEIEDGPPVIYQAPKMVLTIDRVSYEIGDKMLIIMNNLGEEEIRFETQPYGLHFEKLLDGKWEALSANFDYSISYYPSLNDTLTPEGTLYCKVGVTVLIGEAFTLGTYRVITFGKIGETAVEASAEFDVVLHAEEPPVTPKE